MPTLVDALWQASRPRCTRSRRGRRPCPAWTVPPDWNPLTSTAERCSTARSEWLRRARAVRSDRRRSATSASTLRAADRRLGLPVGPAAPRRWPTGVRPGVAATAATSARQSTPPVRLRRVGRRRRLARSAGDDTSARAGWPTPGADLAAPLARPSSAPCEPLRTRGLDDARRLLLRGEVRADDAVRAFDRGVAAASMLGAGGRHRPRRLRRAGARDRRSGGSPRPSRSVREHLTTALPARRAHVPAVRRRRRGSARSARCSGSWPSSAAACSVRALLDAVRRPDHPDHAVRADVSPDSVARFFPAAAGQFDLVVFDEASQIRVADAVGAMGRAQRGGRRRRQQADAADVVRRAVTSDDDAGRRRRRRRSRTRSRSSPSASRPGCRGSGCPGTTAARTSR